MPQLRQTEAPAANGCFCFVFVFSAIWGLLSVSAHFRIGFERFCEEDQWNSMGITMTLQIISGRMGVFAMLLLPIQEQRVLSSANVIIDFLFRVLKFLGRDSSL